MKTTTKVALTTLLGSSAAAVALGLVNLSGNARVIPRGVHGLMGEVTIVSLWIIAAVAVRSGASFGTGVQALLLGLLVQGLGYAQTASLTGGARWLLLGLHVVTSLAVVAWGWRLAQRTQTQRLPMTVKEAAAVFLAKKRIAVTGVSRKQTSHGSNIVYNRLRERGYEAFPVNPRAEQIEGDRCYHDLKSIPGGVDAVVIGTRPEVAMVTMRECAELGIKHVWMHRSVGTGSVSNAATAWGRAHGIHVIDGGCPLMFDPTADPGHKVMRPLFVLTGKVPRRVS